MPINAFREAVRETLREMLGQADDREAVLAVLEREAELLGASVGPELSGPDVMAVLAEVIKEVRDGEEAGKHH